VETLDTHNSHRGRNSVTVSVINEVPLKWHLLPDQVGFDMFDALVESWVEPDANTIILNVRQGIKFHDGSDLTAQVIKWNLERMMASDKFVAKGQLGHIGSIEAVGDYTVKLNIPKPTAVNFVSLGTHFSIISKAQFDALGAVGYGFNPSGTGPLQLKKWVPDVKKETERFAGYWRDGVDGEKLPYVDMITDRVILSGGVALAELETNQLDMFKLLEADQVPVAKDSDKIRVHDYVWTGTRRPLIGFNARSGIFSDVRLRKAAQWALDREAQAKAFGPSATPHYFPYQFSTFFNWNPDLPHYTYDPDKAKALVKEVDPDGEVEVTLINICREPDNSMALIIKAMWDAVGINTTLDCQEVVAWVNSSKADQFEANFYRGNQNGPDPDFEYRHIDRSGGANWTNTSTPGLAECWLEARYELDQGKRQTIYDRCNTLLFDSAQLSVSFLEVPNHVERVQLKGVGIEGAIATYMQEVWLDE
jgi:peptide/nickel transport system substrate-binding protein